jgi:uncharacterized integral membrane protein (TIGR00697 family)
MSNWYDSRIIEVFGISVTPGTLVYSITFLLSNVITEVYGFKSARKAIWMALLFNVIFLAYGILVLNLPTPEGLNYNYSFDSFLRMNTRIITASFISYLISEPINSFLIAKFKLKTKGKYLGIRFISSVLISGVIDSLLFIIIAFYGTLSNAKIISLILHIWAVKTVVEIMLLPLSINIAKNLKISEQLDIYDSNTTFTMLSLNSDYVTSNNQFKK